MKYSIVSKETKVSCYATAIVLSGHGWERNEFR